MKPTAETKDRFTRDIHVAADLGHTFAAKDRMPPMRQAKRGQPETWSAVCRGCGRSVIVPGGGSATTSHCQH